MTNDPAPDWIAAAVTEEGLLVWELRGPTVLRERRLTCPPEPSPDDLAATLSQDLAQVPPAAPVVLAGAAPAGAAPPVPCTPPGAVASAEIGTRRLHLVPGLRQDGPVDLLPLGAVTVAGYLALNPGWDGVVCLPGRTTHWVQVSAGEIVSFQSYLGGAMRALLAIPAVPDNPAPQDEAFDAGLAEGIARPERIMARLHEAIARLRLGRLDAAAADAQLDGLLIGAELAAARAYWLGQEIAVLGSGPRSDRYARALAAQGAPCTRGDGNRMTLEGLKAARQALGTSG